LVCVWPSALSVRSHEPPQPAAASVEHRVRPFARELSPPVAQALRRARARAEADPGLRRRIRAAAAREQHLGGARPHRESRSRAASHAAPGTRSYPGDRGERAMRRGASRGTAAQPGLSPLRAAFVFAALLAALALLLARSFYLQ